MNSILFDKLLSLKLKQIFHTVVKIVSFANLDLISPNQLLTVTTAIILFVSTCVSVCKDSY